CEAGRLAGDAVQFRFTAAPAIRELPSGASRAECFGKPRSILPHFGQPGAFRPTAWNTLRNRSREFRLDFPLSLLSRSRLAHWLGEQIGGLEILVVAPGEAGRPVDLYRVRHLADPT